MYEDQSRTVTSFCSAFLIDSSIDGMVADVGREGLGLAAMASEKVLAIARPLCPKTCRNDALGFLAISNFHEGQVNFTINLRGTPVLTFPQHQLQIFHGHARPGLAHRHACTCM